MRLTLAALETVIVRTVTSLAELTVTTDAAPWANLKLDVSYRAAELHVGVVHITEAALDLAGTPHEGTAAVLAQAAQEVRAVAWSLNDLLVVI